MRQTATAAAGKSETETSVVPFTKQDVSRLVAASGLVEAYFDNGSRTRASAVLIQPKQHDPTHAYLLLSAHFLSLDGTSSPANIATFAFGRTGRDKTVYEWNQSDFKAVVSPDYRRGSFNADVGIVRIPIDGYANPWSTTPVFTQSLPYESNVTIQRGTQLLTASYPTEFVPSDVEGETDVNFNVVPDVAVGTVTDVNGNVLGLRLLTDHGASGAGLFTVDGKIAAIISGGNDASAFQTYATRVPPLDLLFDAVRA